MNNTYIMYNSFSHTKDNDFFDINLLKNIFLVYIWFWSRMTSIEKNGAGLDKLTTLVISYLKYILNGCGKSESQFSFKRTSVRDWTVPFFLLTNLKNN